MRVEILSILILAILTTLSNASFRRYTDYKQYLNEWKKIVPEKYIHDVTDIALDVQLCYGKKCQFFYFQSEDSSITDPVRQKTVLLVSGMHGNQFLGPHTLLYAYPHLKAHRIVYFPMANPSGFNLGTRQTFPNKIDANRDYPIDGNTNCYQTSATHILDMLFRKYKFDLTVILHNGGTQIGFNWGTNHHAANSHTEEYNIFLDIAQMMQEAGGESKQLALQKFQIGTMVQTIYAASGTFDDWAYAAGKFPDLITKCKTFQYQPYPKDMANGLAFLIEMGPFSTNTLGSEYGINLPSYSSNRNNGHIARVIRILKAMMKVINPKLVIQIENGGASLIVQGCRSAKIEKLLIFAQNQNKSWVRIYEQEAPIQILKRQNRETIIQLLSPVEQNTLIRYQGTLQCDYQWIGKGTTSFSKPRTFSFQNIQNYRRIRRIQEFAFMEFYQIAVEWKYYIGLALIVLLVLAFMLFRRCSKKQKIQRFEEVEFVGRQGQSEHPETQQDMGGDLHTARGGIINM